MKGIPIFRLKRLKRTAILLGAGTLVAGAALLGAARANAAVGTCLLYTSPSPRD